MSFSTAISNSREFASSGTMCPSRIRVSVPSYLKGGIAPLLLGRTYVAGVTEVI